MSPRVRTASSLAVTEEMLQRAYVRSRWTLGSTPDAERAVAMAIAHLPDAGKKMRERQRKRGKGTVNCVLLDEANRFDYAVLEEIERAELWQERNGHRLTQEELTKRFVKTPIKFALHHNGYYAAIAMCTAFADYTCGELQKLYHHASIDRPKPKADRECARVNTALFERLYQRFGHVAALEPCSDPAKLPRLRREAPTAELLACLRQGLATHAPSVRCPVDLPRSTRENPVFSDDPDEAEMQRIGLFFDPVRFDSLAALLRVAGFDRRARTIIVRTDSQPPETEPEPEGDDLPLARIRALIDDEMDRMQSARPGPLRIRVDGIERARLDVTGQSVPMLLEAHAGLVEIVADAADSTEVVIGSYILSYDGEKSEEWELQLPWSDYDRLVCSFDYGPDDCVGATFEMRRRTMPGRRSPATVWLSIPHEDSWSARLRSGDVILDRYEIVRFLGMGAWGETFLAFDASRSQPVALKVMSCGAGGAGKSTLLGLKADFDRLEHHRPRIANIYDVCDYDDHPVIVQEFVEGSSLREVLRDGRLSATDAFEYATWILEGVGEIHRRGLAHRDLKPSNIMVGAQGIKILDFGIARCLERPRACEFVDAYYTAPEAIALSHADARSDVFSMGVVLWEMLTGARPLDRVPPVEINPSLPTDLSDVVVRALSPDPDERYSDANAFRDAWLDCRESLHRSTVETARRDRQLLQRFGASDTSAFETLRERYEALLCRTNYYWNVPPAERESRTNQIWAWLMFDGRDDGTLEIGDRLWRDARRASCIASTDVLALTVDRLVLLECKAALEVLSGADAQLFVFEQHRAELAWLTRHYRDDLLFERVNRHCFAPQDWRAVVPLARHLAVRYYCEGAPEASISVIADSERLLPRLRMRPSLAAVLAILLER